MSVLVTTDWPAVSSPRLSTERLRGALLWLTGFAGAFVFIEPSPYELTTLLAAVIFVARAVGAIISNRSAPSAAFR